jgi:hypothetical protein
VDAQNLIAVFGWMSVINLCLFVVGLLKLTLFRDLADRVGHMVLGDEAKDWFKHAPIILMGFYILIIVFKVVPYLAMRIVFS